MKLTTLAGSILAASVLPSQVAALPSNSELETRTTCTNGPTSRGCWSSGYNISTDFDAAWPTTGVTVKYHLELTNGTCNPDGHGERLCLLVNGQYPGPLISANWGDELEITVQNSLQDNGTSIHWHGLRQYNTNGQDGTNGLTECPLAPGHSRLYKFQATQHGTSWYHSHFASQYGDGVVGPLIFHGPATANYDVDLGAYPLNEWYYQTASQINAEFGQALNSSGGQGPSSAGPPSNNLLINGTNEDASGAGAYSKVTIEAGKKYRLRLINIGVNNYILASLDGHSFEVITSDFIPIKPITADWLLLGNGQRYDVIINANQTPGNYWFRANVATGCQSASNNNALAIWTYSTVAEATPSSIPFLDEPIIGCQEPSPLTPYWDESVPPSTLSYALGELNLGTTNAVVVPGEGSVVVWALNASINIDWEKPTLSYVMEGNTSYPEEINLVPTTSMNQWNYWLIQQHNAPPIPHPIHLHGHDYYVLGQGQTGYDFTFPDLNGLNFKNPTRRDTATIYSGGWLAVAFKSDNPGAWLMHCHIAWHISEGLGMQFLEEPSRIVLPDKDDYNAECAAWDEYYPTSYWKKTGSGL